jgi:ArsR family transcriptional regulator
MANDAKKDPLDETLDRLSQETDTCTLAEFQQMADEISSDPEFEHAVLQAGALANEKRLITLSLLRERGSLCACEIQAALDCTNATVSHHMDCLIEANLVESEKQGKWKYYELTDEGRRLSAEVLP